MAARVLPYAAMIALDGFALAAYEAAFAALQEFLEGSAVDRYWTSKLSYFRLGVFRCP